MEQIITITRTRSAVAGRAPAPVYVRIDGTEARSALFAGRRDVAVSPIVREINALALEANEALRAHLAR